GELLDQVGVDPTRLHQRDAMLEAKALGADLRELFLSDAELGLGRFERKLAARAPDRAIAEIGGDREARRRQHHGGEHARHTSPDSHAANESPTDSGRQAENRKRRGREIVNVPYRKDAALFLTGKKRTCSLE